MKRLLAQLVFLGTFAATPQGCHREAEPSGPPNVLLVTMCTLRADHSDLYGYERTTTPNLDRLAAEGSTFDNAFAAANWTNASVATILSGTYPATHDLLYTSNSLTYRGAMLPGVLRAYGYRSAVLAQGHGLAMVGPESGLTLDFDWFSSTTTGSDWNPAQILPALASEPFLAYVHIRHARMYNLEPEIGAFADDIDPRISRYIVDSQNFGGARGVAGGITPEVRFLRQLNGDPGLMENFVGLYDSAIEKADAMLGELLGTLGEAHLLDNTVIVVTADHGESLGENGQLMHGTTLDDTQMRIPLVIRLPDSRKRGVRIVDTVGHADIMPTILELAGATAPAGMEGRSLVPLLLGQKLEPRPVLSQIPDRGREDRFRLLERVTLYPYAIFQDAYNGSWRAIEYRGREVVDLSGTIPPEVLALVEWQNEHGAAPDLQVGPSPVDDATRQQLQREGYW